MQIAGKTRLAATPWLNHSWHVTFELTARGLSTPLIHFEGRGLQIAFDFIDHELRVSASDGQIGRLPLRPMSVAAFYEQYQALLSDLGSAIRIHDRPNEIPDAVPFGDDHAHSAYDGEYANRFWRVLLATHDVFYRFRTAFLGKSSPVHFFWGSFDLAVTRFSGRRAPLHPGGFPGLPDAVVREAYSHEVSSAGFWPGGGPIDYAAFYSYAYPAPDGFASAPVRPSEASFNTALGEFLLPYDAVREARDPDQHLMAFLESTYAAAADFGSWDRAALECFLGQIGRPRKID
jgi:hypothetical protein